MSAILIFSPPFNFRLKFGVVGIGVNIYLLNVGKVFNVSFQNLLFMLRMTSSRTILLMAEKKIKMADLLRFFTFYVNNLILWFSCILFKFVLHVTDKQF